MSGSSTDRTERPTPKRLRDARRKGQVGASRDLTSAVGLCAAVGALALLLPDACAAVAGAARAAIETSCAGGDFDAARALATLDDALMLVLRVALPSVAAAAAAGALAGAIQTSGLAAPGALSPKLERLSPLTGFKRLVGVRAAVESVKTWAKLAVVGAAAASAIVGHAGELAGAVRGDGTASLALAWAVTRSVALRTAVATLALGAADFLIQRKLHERDLRMTKDEVRREFKEEEGDPHVKHARKRAHRELALEQMVASARTANVVLVNPTRIAAALRFDEAEDDAPRVVAKGTGHVAARIRAAALEAGVPVVPNRALARALVRVPVDEPIPEELYSAVAEVLAFVGEALDAEAQSTLCDARRRGRQEE